MSVILCPMVRQIYLYVARKDVERIGTQTWVLFSILAVEVLIILKFGRNQFANPTPPFVWKMWAIVLSIYAIFCFIAITQKHNPKEDDPVQAPQELQDGQHSKSE